VNKPLNVLDEAEQFLAEHNAAQLHIWRLQGFNVRWDDETEGYAVDRFDGDQVEGKLCETLDDVEACIATWKHVDPIYTFELNVPSGKMVVANDLRHDWPVVGDYDVNSNYGCRMTSEQYAERAGMAHAFVGNTCPGMNRLSLTEFIIGVDEYAEDGKPAGKLKGEEVAGICTDLWWYSIVDYDDFVQRLGKPKERAVVECKPGVYQFRHLFHALDRNGAYPQVYTEIKWARKPDKVRDYRAEYDALNFTAEQIVADMLRGEHRVLYEDAPPYKKTEDWPSMPANAANRQIWKAVNQLIVVLGNGQEYHKNGWLGGSPDLKPDVPGVEIPEFHGKFHWYPLCDSSFLVRAAGDGDEVDYHGIAPKDIHLNESFVRLAFNVLYCMVRYGTEDGGSHSKEYEKATIKNAQQALRGFARKYPTQIPACVRTLLDEEDQP